MVCLPIAEAIPPGNVQVSHVSSSTVSLTWETPADLKPGLKYDFQIKTQLKSGGLSQPASTSAHTEAVPPGNVKVSHVSSSTVSLTWETPAGEVEGYVVTCFCDSKTHQKKITVLDSVRFSDLKPGLKYDFQIKTQLKSGGLSQPTSTSAHTEAIPPGNVQVSHVSSSTVSLTWEPPAGDVGGYVVTCFCDSETHGEQTTDSVSVTFSDLKPGLKYDFQIKTQLKSGGLSQPALISAHTDAVPPGNVQVSHITSSTVSLTWEPPAGLKYDFQIKTQLKSGGLSQPALISAHTDAVPPGNVQVSHITSSTVSLTWEPPAGLKYDFQIKTQLKSGGLSQPALISAHTDAVPPGNVQVSHITSSTVSLTWEPPAGLKYDFQIKTQLKSGGLSQPALISAHTDAVPPGNVQVSHITSSTVSLTWEPPAGLKYDFQIKTQLKSGGLSQPALISAHTDAVPPGNVQVSHITSSTVSLTWEPPAGLKYDFQIKTQLKSGGLSQPALISAHTDAVPPGNVQVSHITSSTVSLTWEPPAGLKYDFQIKTQLNSGGLSQPALISAHTDAVPPGNVQVSHITSSTVSLTWEPPAGLKYDFQIKTQLKSGGLSQPALISAHTDAVPPGNVQVSHITSSTVSLTWEPPAGLKYDFQIKTQLKSGGLSQPALISAHTDAVPPGNVQVSHITSSTVSLTWEPPAGLKYDFQIKTQLKSGGLSQPALISAHTDAVPPGNVQVSHITSSTVSLTWEPPAGLKYDFQIKTQLKSGGLSQPALISAHTDAVPPGNVQVSHITSSTVSLTWEPPAGLKYDFQIKTQMKSGGLSQPALISAHTETELEGFLKMLGLKENYKEKHSLSSVLQIDKKAVTEEAAKCLSDLPWCFLKKLMMLCAQLLIDGFPLELVDGEASGIPLTWVKDVFSELRKMVDPESKIRVVTVLGIQSTGKSTLLNTMFGVQFAVSSGRCTRGAFMLLIRVNKEYSKEMNCDFLIIIDTEGLKSLELAQLEDSHEHDNELATIVVGLSDITIVNIAMENMTDMKDILQIVVHAFLRMKVGKKPKCLFVHQNLSDVSAHDNNLRDRTVLIQQLNEMTQAAAKVEKKEENKSFKEVMEYDPDTGNRIRAYTVH
ncbi:unnamed protein product [Boreogadus saida]